MNLNRFAYTAMCAAVAGSLLVCPTVHTTAQGMKTVTIDAGTVIPVKLRDTLSSTDSHTGDRFTATLQSEDAARSLNLPVGTNIEGTVSAVRSMQGSEPGVLSLSFDRMILPNESSYAINGALIGLDDKSVTRASNGRLVAKADHKNKTLLYAGYGAGAGLILGALTKGNTILDTLIGGGLGYLLGSLDKSHGNPKDVVLKPNTELGVRLDRSVRVKFYDDGSRNAGSDATDNRQSHTNRNGDSTGSRNDPNRDPYDDSTSSRNNADRDRYDDSTRSGNNANRDRYDDPTGSRNDSNRDRDRDSTGSRNDSNRDPYDESSTDNRAAAGLDTYGVLNRYTDIEDNGQPVRVVVNGRQLSFLTSARPFISGGNVIVPAIPVLKAAHGRYTYTSTQFTAYGPGESLTGTFGSRVVKGSGTHRFTLPATIQRRNGTIYVPIQFMALVTGQKLSFDRESQTMELGRGSNDRASQP